jgi:hypothetical protein
MSLRCRACTDDKSPFGWRPTNVRKTELALTWLYPGTETVTEENQGKIFPLLWIWKTERLHPTAREEGAWVIELRKHGAPQTQETEGSWCPFWCKGNFEQRSMITVFLNSTAWTENTVFLGGQSYKYSSEASATQPTSTQFQHPRTT